MADRYPLRSKGVQAAVGLDYDHIRRALISGELVGLVAPRLLRTNKEAVAAWRQGLKNKPPSQPSSTSDDVANPHKERACRACRFVDPSIRQEEFVR